MSSLGLVVLVRLSQHPRRILWGPCSSCSASREDLLLYWDSGISRRSNGQLHSSSKFFVRHRWYQVYVPRLSMQVVLHLGTRSFSPYAALSPLALLTLLP